jgi:hypothetical protein
LDTVHEVLRTANTTKMLKLEAWARLAAAQAACWQDNKAGGHLLRMLPLTM